PYTTFSIPVFISFLIMWGILSWAITPVIQSYLIVTSPETSDIQQSLNNSTLHFGIAFGSFIGIMIIDHTTFETNASVSDIFVIVSLFIAVFSFKSKIHTSTKANNDTVL